MTLLALHDILSVYLYGVLVSEIIQMCIYITIHANVDIVTDHYIQQVHKIGKHALLLTVLSWLFVIYILLVFIYVTFFNKD